MASYGNMLAWMWIPASATRSVSRSIPASLLGSSYISTAYTNPRRRVGPSWAIRWPAAPYQSPVPIRSRTLTVLGLCALMYARSTRLVFG